MGLLKNLKRRFRNRKLQLDPKLFTKEEIKLFNKIKNFEISDVVLNYYKTNIKSNKNRTKEMATKKLIRNIMLSGECKINMLKHKHHDVAIFYYGNLKILTNFKTKKITWLNNNDKCYSYFRNNKKKKKYLNKILNIHN